jgi:hypothetical protein
MHRSAPALPLLIAALYTGLALLSALTQRPVCDEGWFSNPAVNLITNGSMGTTVLDPSAAFRGMKLHGIERHTYWIMPFYILVQAAWYRCVGFSLVRLRLLSVLCGLAALFCWYSILKRLCSRGTALIATVLLATDFHFLVAAGNGRMDMMTFTLGSGALASYLGLRETHLDWAVIVSQVLAAAAFFTHPLGILSVAALAFITLYQDFTRLRWRHAAIAVIPYAAGGTAWAAYILQSPADFMGQLGTNASGRFRFLTSPLSMLRREISIRYLNEYGLERITPLFSRLKCLILAVYVAGAAVAFGARRIRQNRSLLMLLALAAWMTVGVMLIDSFAQPWYIVHLAPYQIVLVAISASYLRSMGRGPAVAIALVLTAVVAVQLMVSTSRAAKGERQDFLAAAGFVRDHLGSGQLAMASAEFGIPLNFDSRLIDDYRLGYRSGKKADLIVMDTQRYLPWDELLQDQDPDNYRYIRGLLSNYSVIYNQGGYRIYSRPGAESRRP